MILSYNVQCHIYVTPILLEKPKQETMVHEMIPKRQAKKIQKKKSRKKSSWSLIHSKMCGKRIFRNWGKFGI